MTLAQQIAEAEAAHLEASRLSDVADAVWFEQYGELFFDPGVLERQAEADNERIRTFERLHLLKWREAWGLGA